MLSEGRSQLPTLKPPQCSHSQKAAWSLPKAMGDIPSHGTYPPWCCRNTSCLSHSGVGMAAGAYNEVAEEMGVRHFSTWRGNEEPVFTGRGGRGRTLPIPLLVKLTSVQPGVQESSAGVLWRGSWSGYSSVSQQDPRGLHCSSLDSFFCPPSFFSIQQLSTSVTLKVKISQRTRSSTRGVLTPSAIITLGPAASSKLTRWSEQPFLFYNLQVMKEKNIWAHVSPVQHRLNVSLCVKIPSNSRSAPLKGTPFFWGEWHDSRPQHMRSRSLFWWKWEERTLCALLIFCTEAIPLKTRTEGPKCWDVCYCLTTTHQ